MEAGRVTPGERLQWLLASAGEPAVEPGQRDQFEAYLALLMRWNTRVNLSAIREEEGVLRRHFVESIGCARRLPPGLRRVLDFGSGGGFPGIPVAICRPEVVVTLGESQGKKAAFLAEVVRTLGLNARVHAGRVEELDEEFDAVTLRAVDRMAEACRVALGRVKVGGWFCAMTTLAHVPELAEALDGVAWRAPVGLPGSEHGVVLLGRRLRG